MHLKDYKSLSKLNKSNEYYQVLLQQLKVMRSIFITSLQGQTKECLGVDAVQFNPFGTG